MIVACTLALIHTMLPAEDPKWSDAVVVRHGSRPAVRFQARIDGDHLFVRAKHEPGWHTYAMDNKLRVEKTLAGKQSLGIEQGIEIEVKSGLKLDDRWRQTRPRDLSQPELRWYKYGFDKTALFACRITSASSAPIVIQIRGQACNEATCRQIDVVLELGSSQPAKPSESVGKTLERLVPVARPSADPEG